MKHPSKGTLDVSLVKGCPLIARSVGMKILEDYEALRETEGVVKGVSLVDLPEVPSQ